MVVGGSVPVFVDGFQESPLEQRTPTARPGNDKIVAATGQGQVAARANHVVGRRIVSLGVGEADLRARSVSYHRTPVLASHVSVSVTYVHGQKARCGGTPASSSSGDGRGVPGGWWWFGRRIGPGPNGESDRTWILVSGTLEFGASTKPQIERLLAYDRGFMPCLPP
jgi:hypothetical protein